MSAQSASDTAAETTRPTVSATDHVSVRLPSSRRTYELRDVLRGLRLRWDPATHAWHGTLAVAQRTALERDYGLPLRTVVPIERFVAEEEPPARKEPPSPPSQSFVPSARRVVHDSSGTRFESQLALGEADEEEGEEPADPASETRRFSWFETTSDLPDDSREADERAAVRRLRELRACVKAVRATVATTPGLTETLVRDSQKATRFYARFGITDVQLRQGVPNRAMLDGTTVNEMESRTIAARP